MTGRDQLVRQVQAGELIKPWLILGPFYEELSDQVQGLTLFERTGATVGRTAMVEVVEEARHVLVATPREGDEARFRGQTARWSLVRRPEKYLAWGNYYISNHLAAAFLSTIVTPDEPGPRRWRLVTRITSRVVAAINGIVVCDTVAHKVDPANGGFEYRFEAPLQPGEQVLFCSREHMARRMWAGGRLGIVRRFCERTRICPDRSNHERDHVRVPFDRSFRHRVGHSAYRRRRAARPVRLPDGG